LADTLTFPYLIRTKLNRPPLPEDYVPREQLLRQLESAPLRPLTLLTAPAGYGKTTLLSAWLERNAVVDTWVSLDEDDDSLEMFLSYFILALRGLFPNFGDQALSFIQSANLPPLPVVSAYLNDEIEKIGQDFILVLDDFHCITQKVIHDLLASLLRHPHRFLHLVLATRHDPPINLIQLRARNQVSELRSRDLRFSIEEIAVFIRQVLGFPLDAQTVAALEAKTEGWPAVLRLAVLALRQWGDDRYQSAILQVENRFIIDYLVSEVISRQPPAIQEFLMKTSILERFCTPLCQAVLDLQGRATPDLIRQIEEEELFIEPLDNLDEWHRYHQLFRQILQRKLADLYNPVEIAALHSRASAWYAQHNLIGEAIDHALAAGDQSAAVGLVRGHCIEAINQEQWHRLGRWLKKFPAALIDQEPVLLMAKAWTLVGQWQLDRAYQTVDRFNHLIQPLDPDSEDLPRLQASMDVISSIRSDWAGDPQQTITFAEQALKTLPHNWLEMRHYASMHLAVAYLTAGDQNRAYEVSAMSQSESLSNSEQSYASAATASLFTYWMAADLDRILYTGDRIIHIGEHRILTPSLAWCHTILGSVQYQRNHLAVAEAHFNLALEQRFSSHPISVVQAAIGLARVYEAQGLEREVWQAVEMASRFCQEVNQVHLSSTVEAFKAELALLQGEIDRASDWAAHADPITIPKIMPFPYQPQFTLPKVLLAQATPRSLQRARQHLSQLYDLAFSTHNTRYQIEVLALQAMLQNALGDQQAAFECLSQSIQLAQPGGFIRLYVDLGPKMAPLLGRLREHSFTSDYVDLILAAFPASLPASPSPAPSLIEPLTDRELEILDGLAKRLSNKEIARELFISPGTVKRHTINIYQKLDVSTRREAVDRAADLGILSIH
jgi:LuxR family maltose regulon positive regulatory protein